MTFLAQRCDIHHYAANRKMVSGRLSCAAGGCRPWPIACQLGVVPVGVLQGDDRAIVEESIMFAHACPHHLSARFATIHRAILLFLLLAPALVVATPGAAQDNDCLLYTSPSPRD